MGNKSNFTEILFPLKVENSFLTNLDSVKTVGDLTELYCLVLSEKEMGSLTLPYNFNKRKFDNQANTGIRVFGHPSYCTALSGWQRTLSFTWQETKWTYEYFSLPHPEYLNNNLDSLIRLNILNYGHDPTLSVNPYEAIFEIEFYPEKELVELEGFLGELASGYQRFLIEQVSASLPLDSLQKKFPLNIMISELHDLPLVPTDSLLEIDF
jgi:hypothetical protein